MTNPVQMAVQSLNVPFHTKSRAGIRKGAIHIYDGRCYRYGSGFIEVVPNILVNNDITDEYTAEYFNTAITAKEVYAPLYLYGGYLPTTINAKYQILTPGQKPDESDWDYKKIQFDTETTLAELYKNAHWYQYNHITDSYLKLPKKGAQQNSLKLHMQREIIRTGGDSYDRIADLSRMILFLLSKVTLTPEERRTMSPLLDYAQSASELADLFGREKNIQDYVAKVKADPEKYINEDR